MSLLAHYLIAHEMLFSAPLLSTEPAAEPALGLRGLLLDCSVEGVDFLHGCFLGIFAVLLEFSFGFGSFRAGFVYLWRVLAGYILELGI